MHIERKMFAGICRLGLILPEGNSLKEKRNIVKSIIERLRHRFNISIAEVERHDALRRAGIGFAVVSNEKSHLEKLIHSVVNHIELDGRVEIEFIEQEIL